MSDEFLVGNPRCPICAGHHPVKAACFFSVNLQSLAGGQMSDDLVKKLRAQGQKNYGLSAEAADAIEALTAEVAALKHDIARHMQIANDVEAEAARLRGVLNVLVSALDATHWSSWQTTYIFQKPLDDARAALRGEEG